MASKFIQLDEAAEMIGITPDQLKEARESNKIRGFRDGQTWKFKTDDLENLKSELAGGGGAGDELTLDVGLDEAGDEGDSVLLSEHELGGSDVIGSSTILRDSGKPDSDITLAPEGDTADDSKIEVTAEESKIELVGDSMVKDSDISLEGSGVEKADAGSELGLEIGEASSLELDLSEDDEPKANSDTGRSDLDLTSANESNLSLSEEDLSLDSGSGIEGESAIDLSGEDEDLVLGGTDSDVTIGASDSGISLADPADSGLSLEDDALELGGSVIGDESLVLGEDDDMITLGDEVADPSAATQLKSDDDFLLTPLDEGGMDDESESGSQVIALDETGEFDQSAATLLGEGQGVGMLDEDQVEPLEGAMPAGGGAAAVAAAPQGAAGIIMQQAVPEAPYSIWNVLSLFVCILLLCFTGMMMYDVVRQIWSWEGTHAVNSGLMEGFINTFMK